MHATAIRFGLCLAALALGACSQEPYILDDQELAVLDGALPDSDWVARAERSLAGHAMESEELVGSAGLAGDEMPAAPPLGDADDDSDGIEPLGQELAFPGSALTLVANPTGPVQRTTVQLAVDWKTGELGVCSGTLIRADAVLTAAHCVFRSDRRGWAAAITATPGAQAGQSPAAAPIAAKRSFALQAYRAMPHEDPRGYPFDYAVVRLKRSFAVGTRSLGEGSKSRGTAFVVRGYPSVIGHASYDGEHMFESRGSVSSTRSDGVFYHRASTHGGMSGAGIDDGARIVGVHTSGAGNTNSGVVFSTATLDTITDWATRSP